MVSTRIKSTSKSAHGGRRKGSGKRAGPEGPAGLRLVQAMADASRWAILELLASDALGVVAIARRIDRSIGCTSRHVSILREEGLVRVRRQGKSLACSWPEAGTPERALLETLFGRVAPPRAPRLPVAVEAPSEAPLAGVPARDVAPPPPRPRSNPTDIPEFETYRNVSRPARRPSPDLDDYLL
jgi:hypothetical protein